jgi:diguanylate cyclase (GGDEF)-like protein/PAS domain S-box-containing protein
MAPGITLLQTITEALDGLGIATCILDQDDKTLLWNRSFIELFPEHAAEIHVGESYRSNLRRFYQSRLGSDEMHAIDQYIDGGIARHRTQQRPFTFEHRGIQLWAASVALPGIGRVRMWRPDTAEKRSTETMTALSGMTSLSIDTNTLFDYIVDGVMVTSPAGRIVWVNQPFIVMYNYKNRADATGITLEDAYRNAWTGQEQNEIATFERGLSKLIESQRFSGAPFEIPLPHDRCAMVTGQRNPDGNSYFIHVEITALKRHQQQLLLAEQKIRDSESLLKATLERMEQGIVMVNAQRVVEVCNRRALELLGLPAEFMNSRPTVDEVLEYQSSHNEFERTEGAVTNLIHEAGILDKPHRYDRKRPDGRVIEVDSVPIQGGGVLRTYTDITERKRQEEHIRHIARHDGLTSLVTRDVFLECLNEAILEAERGGQVFAVHYLDVDHFKPINDRHGHPVGDKALALLAARMRKVARDADVVARLGGDEFAILQLNIDRPDAALSLARRMLHGVGQPFTVEQHELQVGASIGIALYPESGSDAETLLRLADTAMYEAKSAGRNDVRIYHAREIKEEAVK